MKKRILLPVLLLLLACLLLVSCVHNGVSVSGLSLSGYTYDHADRYTAGDARVSGKVGELDISWVAGQVNIARHDGDDVRLSETASRALGDEEALHWWLDGEKLYVKYAASGFQGKEALGKQLTVLLPEEWVLEKAVINVVSANVQAEALEAERITVSTVSGDMRASVRAAEQISVSTVSGDVSVEAEQVNDMAFSSVSGTVRICLPEGTGFTADVESVSGDVSGSMPMAREDDDRYISGDGRCRISISTVSGDVRLDQLSR